MEAGLEPGFALVDETEIPRVVQAATDCAIAVGNRLASTDPNIAMLLAQLGPSRTHRALVDLIRRRLVVTPALNNFLRGSRKQLDAEVVCRESIAELRRRVNSTFDSSTPSNDRSVLETFCSSGSTGNRQFLVVVRDLKGLEQLATGDVSRIRAVFERLRRYFLTQKGKPRRRFTFGDTNTANPADVYRKKQ